jgi:rSAM/selenodomain-associated transferase 1
MRTALIVFAKAPEPGRAKTRLIPALGADGAAALAARLLAHAVGQAAEAARALAPAPAGSATLALCTTPDTVHPAFATLAREHALTLTAQGDGDLGARMDRALTRALQGHDAALLIGTDAPALDAAVLQRAAAALAGAPGHDAVFVPALDGGYALVGLRRAAPMLFADIDWGSARVMAQTRERARAAGLRWAELPPLADIDVPADLAHLPPGWLP